VFYTLELNLQISALRKANKFLFALSALLRSVTPLCQKVIFPKQCTSLDSNLVMRPEFIPLCGVREAGGVLWGNQYTVDKERSSKAGQ
jgi:hypothetical protein